VSRLLCFLLLLCAVPAGADPATRAIRARLPDGRTLAFSCAGTGSPTILLEAGWAADSRAFAPLMAPLSRHARVCAYDRAGAGGSSPGPLPRSPTAIAQDLVAGLAAAGISGPLILVGHSAGALYVRQAAALLPPGRVVSMLLLDPSVDDQTAVLEARAGPGAGSVAPIIARSRRCLAAARATPRPPVDDPALKSCGDLASPLAAVRWEARLSEIETVFAPNDVARAARVAATAPVPVVVLTAGAGRSPPLLALWEELHRALAAQSGSGRQQVVPGAGHMMMRDSPDAVIAAVLSLMPPDRAPAAAPS
jgi:pimeloyl-ACP methyl ester carboxylesterase